MEVGQGPNWGCSANGKKRKEAANKQRDNENIIQISMWLSETMLRYFIESTG
jgi:hypothetical protein